MDKKKLIEIFKEEDEISSITINGENLDSDDGEIWFCPKGLLRGIQVDELPENVEFELCNRIENGTVIMDSAPLRLCRVGKNKIRFTIEDSGTRKYWNGKFGFGEVMLTKRAIIEERTKEVGDIKFISFEDDGAYIFLLYETIIEAEFCETAIELAEQIIGEIDGAVEIRLGGELFEIGTGNNEQEFTIHVVLPILRKLGFHNVRYNHGRREYGKDIVFARPSEFGGLEHWAAQVKYGDISGGINSEIDTILGQIDDAFKMPFYDIYTRGKQKISKMAIIISGRFTENAIEKIIEKIESNSLKNNIEFIDGEKIQTLIERIRK